MRIQISECGIIRKEIWCDEKVMPWYSQNILLFVKKERIKDLKIPISDIYSHYSPIALVHPKTYLSKIKKINKMSSVKGSFKLFLSAIKNVVKQPLSKTRQQCAPLDGSSAFTHKTLPKLIGPFGDRILHSNMPFFGHAMDVDHSGNGPCINGNSRACSPNRPGTEIRGGPLGKSILHFVTKIY